MADQNRTGGGKHRKPESPPDPEQTQRVPEMQKLIDTFIDPDGGK